MKKSTGKIGKICGEYSYVLVFLAVFIVYAIASSGLTWSGVMNVFRHSAVIGIIGLGMGIICLTGEIDLSVGSMLALDAGFSVIIFNITDNIFLTLLFAVAFGILCGLVNGFMVGYMEMPAFIVTLATMLIYRSFAQYFCQHVDKELIGGGSSVYRMSNAKNSYQALYNMGNGKIATFPIVGIILLLLTILLIYVSTSTKYGKKIYAVGSNPKGARMAGINVPLMKISVFAIAGAFVGIASFIWIAMNASADPATTGSSYEMYAIAAVVLGGISMSGGKGECAGILFGAMSYTVIDKIIVSLKMDSLINNAIKGIILLLVIMIQAAGAKMKARSK
ncbi:MAG: ABC transporter permease [Clostridiales bacterium]|nr:ABC transporter permease [Clostridiales bacterium]MCD8154817.1 ABC transporter permease [Clostridiales bacterium]